MHPNRVWINYKVLQILQFFNFSIFIEKPNLEASAVLETCSNRFFPHKNPNLNHNFAKNKNSIFRHFCFFVGPKMALFVHCWRFDSACHIICNQRKYCQISKSIWIPFEGEIASKLCQNRLRWQTKMKNAYIFIHGHYSLLKPIPIDFFFILSKIKTQFFAIFAFFIRPKMALFVVGNSIQPATIISNQRKSCQNFKSMWTALEKEIASKHR